MFDYKLIEAFAKVISEGSFERAAASLFLTQSAISQRIKQLEETTGQVLLIRRSPPSPTDAGQIILKHYQQVKLLEDGIQSTMGVSNTENSEPTQIAIGINADSLASWFLTAIDPLLADGKILIDLHVDDQEQTHRFLKEGSVAGCISDKAKVIQGCSVSPLGVMGYRMLATRAFIERWFPDGLTIEASQRAPAVIFSRKDKLHHRFLRKSFGIKPPQLPIHYVPTPGQFFSMVASGHAYGMIPDWQYKSKRGEIELIEVDPNTQIEVPLFWHRWNLKSPSLQQITDCLLKATEALLQR